MPRQSLNAVDPSFETQEAWLSNVQVERALGQSYSVSVGYVNAIGQEAAGPDRREPDSDWRHARRWPPDLLDGGECADAREPDVRSRQRLQVDRESNYNAFTATLTKRMQNGFQAQATYTLARGTDNAPLTGTYVVGSGDDRVSDPTNLDRDKGVTPFNQTHTLAVSCVYQPRCDGRRHCVPISRTTTSWASSSRPTAGCRSTSDRTAI